MNRFYLFSLSLLFGLFLYTLPAYSGNGVLGCCDAVRDGCIEVNIPPAEGCEARTEVEGGRCIGDRRPVCTPPTKPDHLVCFQVKDTLKFDTGKDVTETTFFVSIPQFGTDVRCELKGRTREFCVPACKDNLIDDPPVGAGLCQQSQENPEAFDRVCYNIENCKPISGHIDGLQAIVTDQFDDIDHSGVEPRLLTNFNPHQLCTPAEKPDFCLTNADCGRNDCVNNQCDIPD